MPNLLGKIPWLMRLLGRGMNADVRPDQVEDGFHRHMANMRMGSVDGNASSVESIGGERVLFPLDPAEQLQNSNYVCIGMVAAGKDIFSVHASAVGPTKVKINGVTMAESPVIPYTHDRPLQLRSLSRKQGSVVFIADGSAPALYWDVEAIKAAFAAQEQTYFTLLTLQAISVVPSGPKEWPEHMGNPNIGTGAQTGQYVFFLRYYDSFGNKSNFGPPTPHISVAQQQAPIYVPGTSQYPGGQTAGGAPQAAGISTQYGIALKWQIDNRFNNAGVELVVAKFNDALGLNSPGEVEVVFRRDMIPGEFDYIDFVYPRDNNFSEVIPADEAAQQFVNFTAPKTVELIDNRVVFANIALKDEVVQLTFQDSGGNKTFPFTQRVFTKYGGVEVNDGYSDPRNFTYKKSAVHNERYGLGLMLLDGSASKSAVISIDDNVLMPERGRRKTGDSLFYSSDPIYRTNTECQSDDPVSPTFDAIVQGTLAKSDDQYTNVVNGLNYNPWRPQSPADTNYVRYKQKPLSQRRISGLPEYGVDTGAVFNHQIHALGVGIYGPSNLDSEAPWCEVFSVMRTAPANRVVASGMAVYDRASEQVKYLNKLRAHFPDFQSGVVSASKQQNIVDDPQKYKAKLTPYGFYCETYSYENSNIGAVMESYNADHITYMDMQNDPGDGAVGGVNVGEPASGMAIQPGASAPPSRTNNIGWQAWRRLTSDIPGPSSVPGQDYLWFMDPVNTDQGATEITITSFDIAQPVVYRGSVCLMTLNNSVYRGSDATPGSEFSETPTRRFHGPVWIVDIIEPNAVVPDLNVQQYLHTGTHIATRRTIGLFQPDSNGIMQVELFHARLYDAVPRTPGVDDRYAYIQEVLQPERRWMHVDSATGGATIAQVIADINANGFWVAPDGNPVYGLYDSVSSDDFGNQTVWFLRFGAIAGVPPPAPGVRIVVKYDKREPILALGFDATVNPSAGIIYDNSIGPPNNLWPMPYSGGIRSSNYALPRAPTTSSAFEDVVMRPSRSIRQWVVMGTVVTRTPQHMNTGGTDTDRYAFPQMHYIIRPTQPQSFVSGLANGFNPQYDQDYPNEAQWFNYGGFRFKPQYNLIYSKQPNVSGTGIPLNGSNPRTLLPTGHIASFRYNPISQDSPGLRTFTYDNLFIADEALGEVKMIAALDQNGRQLLWGWTEEGYYNIPYNAQMLTGEDGDVVATQSIADFWPRRENWIARGDHGMPDEMWRIAVKANIPNAQHSADTVFWADRNSVYMLLGNIAVDIAINKARSILFPALSTMAADGSPGYSAVFNRKNNEYLLTIPYGPYPPPPPTDPLRPDAPTMFAFDAARKEWVGIFSWRHEQYMSLADRVIASTGLLVSEVNVGEEIGGLPINCFVQVPFFVQYQLRKEAMRWRVVGNMPDNSESSPDYLPFAPSAVQVYDAEGNLLSDMSGAQYALWVKNYDGFEGWVNRVIAGINPSRPLPQSQGFYLRVYYNTFGRKVLASAGMQLKTVK